MKNQFVTAVIMQNDQASAYLRHADRYIAGIVSRMNVGETDKYPGYARWDGDGLAGVQVAWIGNSNINGIISVGQGHGVRLGVTHCKNNHTNKLDMLKELADDLGYVIRKKPGVKKPSPQARPRTRASRKSRKYSRT